MRLTRSWFARSALEVAPDLLGCRLIRELDRASWNLMLPKIHENNERYNMPFGNAAALAARDFASALLGLTAGPITQQVAHVHDAEDVIELFAVNG